MNVTTLSALLRGQKDAAAVTLPRHSPLSDTARDNLTMVTAYLTDGETFLASGDPVNALAAFCYALGWLHCGTAIGLMSSGRDSRCPVGNPVDPLAEEFQDQLAEKTLRYERLLVTACKSVTPSAEEGTVPERAASRILLVASIYAGRGTGFLASGKRESALSCFSYGHGWIDAAVRSGFLSVLAHREIFTI